MSSPSHNSSFSIPENNVADTPVRKDLHHDMHEHIMHYLASPSRRVRTISESERIASSQDFTGTIESFCRNKGHGFIKPDDDSEHIFLHISDIEGEWCPKEGDRVKFKKTLVPPKMQKYQAVHCRFIHLKDGVKHETWDEPNH